MEGFNTLFFFGLSFYIMYKSESKNLLFITYGLWFMSFILLQGTLYWYLKLKSIKGEKINQAFYLTLFNRFKSVNVILGIAIPIVFFVHWYTSGKQLDWDWLLFWGWFTNFFALIEHYNYYHKQLMYDNPFDWRYIKQNRRLKIASLRKDLDEQKI